MSTRTDELSGLWTTEDFAAAAKARLLPEVWDFIDGGAGAESTVRRNVEAFQRAQLRPHALTNVSRVDTSVELMGRQLEAPLIVAPTSTHTMADLGGESATAAAATKLGLAMVVSTMADHPIEQITAAAGEPERIWQQLYIFRDRSVTADLAARAEACGASALVVTIDSPWLGRRIRNLRNHFRFPPGISAGNLAASLATAPDISSPEIYSRDAMDPALTWRDVEALADSTSLPVWVKGVLSGEDATRAISHGVAGVIVSNHGGRQLDRAVPTLRALPEVVAAAGDIPVLMDGGIRSGTDIVIALALGARAVLVGRPVLWGLAAAGEAGVSAILSLLIEEMADVMGQAGRARVADIDRSLLAAPDPDPARSTA